MGKNIIKSDILGWRKLSFETKVKYIKGGKYIKEYSFLNTEQEFGNLDFSLISAGSILEVNPKFIKMDQISLFLSLLAYFILPWVH